MDDQTSQPAVECDRISKSFGDLMAVREFDCEFMAGRITAVVGPNGAGKTTVFHMIGGLLRPDHGRIMLHGRRIDTLPQWSAASKGIGRLFQDVRVFPGMTVLDNVLVCFHHQTGENPLWSVFRRRAVKQETTDLTALAVEWLREVRLHELQSARASDLSFGQQKLLALTRLRATNCSVWLLDEPTSGISTAALDVVNTLITNAAAEGKTVIVIEHNLNFVKDNSDWVYFMKEGHIEAFGLPEDVLANSRVRKAFLGL